MLSKLIFYLRCSRYYTLPMTFFSWIIVFCYSLKHNGNTLYGILALFGIMCSHLATNLFDDICDYKKLTKSYNNGIILPNTQRGKCQYFIDKTLSNKQAKLLFLSYCLISFIIGLFFFFVYGQMIFLFMILGLMIILSYSALSYNNMSELAVGFAFGPLLFSGVYYVMTGDFNINPIILSLPSAIFTVNLLYTDTFLDKDIDKNENKHTLVNILGGGKKALLFQKILLSFGYISVALLIYYKLVKLTALAVLITLPFTVDLIKSMNLYYMNKTIIPKKKWYHFPFEDWHDIKEHRSATFMFRMYQARNLMMYVSLFICFSTI